MAVIMKCSMHYINKIFERIANNLTSMLMLFHTIGTTKHTFDVYKDTIQNKS